MDGREALRRTAADQRLWLVEQNPQEATGALMPVRDGAGTMVHLASAAALLLEAIARGEPGASDAAVRGDKRALDLGELDRVLFPALSRLAVGLLERHAQDRPADAPLIWEVADLLAAVSRPGPPSEPAWPIEPLTSGEIRVLRYLGTHLSAPEIAAELCLSANTVKTHLRHLYRKLGAHNRREVVRRARAAGLLAASSRWS